MTASGWATPALAGLLALISFTGPRALAAQDDIGIALGAKASPVVLEDLDGAPVDLGRWIGRKPLLVEFWATWCPLCEQLMPRLEAAKRRAGERVEFVLVAVAVNQSKRAVRRHFEKHPAPGPVLWDSEGRAVRAFQAPSTSYVVVLDRSGRVVYTGIGTDQKIEEAVARVLGK